MRILYIAQSCDPYNGSEDQIGWSVPWEAAKTNEVFVITRTDLKQSIDAFLENNGTRGGVKMYYVGIPELYQKVFRGPIYTPKLNAWHRKAYPLAKKICQNEGIEVIHQITPVEFRSIGDYGRIPGIKYVCGPIAGGQWIDPSLLCYVRGKKRVMEWLRTKANQVSKLLLSMDGRMKRCDWMIFANRETYQFLGAESMGANTSFLTDVGIDASVLFQQGHTKEPHSEVCFLVPARLVYLKGHDFLLDVLEKLPQELNYVCRIVGGGPLLDHLRQRCESPKLKGKVQVVGAVNYADMKQEYLWADAVLFPSFREATGMVILEAMAYARPVITVNRCGASILLDESSGWFFVGDNLEEYQESFRQILVDCIQKPEKLAEKGKRARDKAMSCTWEEKMKFYQKIYSDLLNDGGGERA